MIVTVKWEKRSNPKFFLYITCVNHFGSTTIIKNKAMSTVLMDSHHNILSFIFYTVRISWILDTSKSGSCTWIQKYPGKGARRFKCSKGQLYARRTSQDSQESPESLLWFCSKSFDNSTNWITVREQCYITASEFQSFNSYKSEL